MSPTEVRLRVDNLLETRFLYLELAARSGEDRGTATSEAETGSTPPQDLEELLERWGASLEALLPEAEGSSKRVAWLSGRVAEALGLRSDMVIRIRLAALLHLLGARQGAGVAGSPAISSWAGAQTDPGAVARIVSGSSIPVLRTARRMLSALEERWDGSGQPGGLRGEAIPIEARIVAAARYWDEHYGPGTEGAPSEADIEALSGTRRGPLVVTDPVATTWIAPDERVRVVAGGALEITW